MRTIIDSLTISMVRQYLIKTGWYIGGEWKRPATMWKLKGDDYAQVILPNSTDLGDYHRAMQRALEELSEVEQRSIDDIVTSIRNREHINIRVVSEDVEAGEIPLSDGASLVRGAYDLVKTTAETIFKKSKEKTKKEQVDSYLRSVTLGQTAVGSYMVNVYSPKISHNDHDLVGDMPVMSSAIVSSLNGLKDSLDRYQESDNILSLSHVSNKKQSEGLCSALLSMGLRSNRTVEISVANGEKQMHSNKVSFDQEYFSAMDKALKFYRDSIFDLKEYEIVGKITRLFRDPESDEGKVTIQAHIEEKSKNIELSLSAEDYDVAIKMHEARGNVVCIGDIQVRKRSAVMTRVISFREIPQTRVDIKE